MEALTLDDFRGSKFRCATLQRQLGRQRGCDASQAKVCNFAIAIVVQQDVLWLQISMNDLPACTRLFSHTAVILSCSFVCRKFSNLHTIRHICSIARACTGLHVASIVGTGRSRDHLPPMAVMHASDNLLKYDFCLLLGEFIALLHIKCAQSSGLSNCFCTTFYRLSERLLAGCILRCSVQTV